MKSFHDLVIMNAFRCLIHEPNIVGHCRSGVHKSWASSQHCKKIVEGDDYYLWLLSMELASCHPFGAYNFEANFRYFENLFIHDIDLIL